eukprot:198848_1
MAQLTGEVVTVGDQVRLTKDLMGTVRFVGEIQGRKGIYYGIELTEARGKSNGTVGNIRIDSIRTLLDQIEGEIQCDQIINGELCSLEDIDYYYFNLSNDSVSILFDSCESSYSTRLSLYDIHFNLIQNHIDIYCGTRHQLLINSLQKGTYILEVRKGNRGYGQWQIQVFCRYLPQKNESKYVFANERYYTSSLTNAAHACESWYGTSLATIMTQNDLNNAMKQIEKLFDRGEVISVWIGLYADSTTSNQFKWLGGSKCDNSTIFAEELHWKNNESRSIWADNSE